MLLHICCGVCAAGSIERLRAAGFQVIGFFCNPNIQPDDEYRRRLDAARLLCAREAVVLEEDDCDTDAWEAVCGARGDEPEGGARCRECFLLRLRRTAAAAARSGIPYLTTTLTISPHKRTGDVFAAGRAAARETGTTFVDIDFKKRDGFRRACTHAERYGLYRQRYCGCRFSLRDTERRRDAGTGSGPP